MSEEREKSSLEGVVKNIIGDLSGAHRFSEESIFLAWKGAAGEAAAKHSQPVSFKKSVLVVNVDGSSWLYELTTRKKEILARLIDGAGGKKIKDVRFRIGEVKKNL